MTQQMQEMMKTMSQQNMAAILNPMGLLNPGLLPLGQNLLGLGSGLAPGALPGSVQPCERRSCLSKIGAIGLLVCYFATCCLC